MPTKRTCPSCEFDLPKNECSQRHIRWKHPYTLKFNPVVNCSSYEKKKKNGKKVEEERAREVRGE